MTDEQLLARILEDPETEEIASTLGLDAADYAARVLFYLKNPGADPQLDIMTPADEKAAGMPSVAETVQWLQKVESGEIPMEGEHHTHFAGFGDDEKSAVTAAGGSIEKKAPRAEETSPHGSPAPAGAPKRGLKKS